MLLNGGRSVPPTRDSHGPSPYRQLARFLKGYPGFGKQDREQTYFLGMFLRAFGRSSSSRRNRSGMAAS